MLAGKAEIIITDSVTRRGARLAEAHNNFGIALKSQGRLAEAEAALRRALACGRTWHR